MMLCAQRSHIGRPDREAQRAGGEASGDGELSVGRDAEGAHGLQRPVDVRGAAPLAVHMHRDAVACPNYKREQTRPASGFAQTQASGHSDVRDRIATLAITREPPSGSLLLGWNEITPPTLDPIVQVGAPSVLDGIVKRTHADRGMLRSRSAYASGGAAGKTTDTRLPSLAQFSPRQLLSREATERASHAARAAT
jgi:hypothetical protein